MKKYLIYFLFVFLSFPLFTFAFCFATPSVTTDGSSSVGSSTATVLGSIVNNGGGTCSMSDGGFSYSLDSTFSTGVSTSSIGVPTVGLQFSKVLSSLSAGSTYYFRAYGVNNVGSAFGSTFSFTPVLPILASTTDIAVVDSLLFHVLVIFFITLITSIWIWKSFML